MDSPDKIVTILVGESISHGSNFCVAGSATSLVEARKICRQAEFLLKHVVPKKHGAYVLIVSSTGHNIFLPIESLLGEADDCSDQGSGDPKVT